MTSPESVYRERCERFARERDAVTVRWERVSNVRLAVFVLAIGALIWGLLASGWHFAVLGILLLLAYVALATYHGTLGRRRQRLADLWAINDEAIKRHARDWDQLPLRHTEPVDPGHPYAVDLDIIGRASLMHLLLAEPTPIGERTLRRWLLAPAPPDAVRERHSAVDELSDDLDLRDDLAVSGRRVRAVRPDVEPFLAWAEGPPWISQYRRLMWAARISPILLAILLIAQLTGITSMPLWIPFVAANLILYWRLGGRSHRVLTRVWEQSGAFEHYATLLQIMSDVPFRSTALRRLQESLRVEERSAPAQVRRLDRLSALAIPRSAALYWPIQIATLWDLHAMGALEKWQIVAGGRIRSWLSALGEVEALAALAALRYDNPEWGFPDVDPSARLLLARGLGHPLLPPSERVDNDLEVGPAGTFLLVTGSNMSGKSTLLRAIGINVVLAGAGGPVCATSFRAPPLTLWTSMRLQDSLERGVSYFMAELQRLKQVVDAARTAGGVDRDGHHTAPPMVSADRRRFLYLLDEILQGTNTAERQIAARRIITYLIDSGAIGAVSTHDLTLADAPELASRARMVHFSETITNQGDGPGMTFDYRLYPGIATSTNALKLMEIVGLDLGDEYSVAGQERGLRTE
jgi:predicted ATPase